MSETGGSTSKISISPTRVAAGAPWNFLSPRTSPCGLGLNNHTHYMVTPFQERLFQVTQMEAARFLLT